MDRLTASPAGETSWRWPDGRRTWRHRGRAWDTIGQPWHAVAVAVPNTWHVYSGTEPVPPLNTLGLSIVRGSCYGGERRSMGLERTISSAVRTRDPERPAYAAGFDAPVGLALGRPPTAVLAPGDAPDPRQIRRQLRRADPGAVPPTARCRWLGVHQFENMAVGVLSHVGPTPGIRYAVVELHGDHSRAVITVRRRERCASGPAPAPQAASRVAGDHTSPSADALWIGVADRLQQPVDKIPPAFDRRCIRAASPHLSTL